MLFLRRALTPIYSTIFNNIPWSIVSKAILRSKKIPKAENLLSKKVETFCDKSNKAIVIYLLPLKPLTCCIKSHCTPATLAPAHTPCLFSIDLHTVRQHLLIVHFLLLLLLSGTLFQMMSDVPHHSHHLSLV